MKEEKFKILNYIRELIVNIDKNMDNFPKKDIELKNRIRKYRRYLYNCNKINLMQYINTIECYKNIVRKS